MSATAQKEGGMRRRLRRIAALFLGLGANCALFPAAGGTALRSQFTRGPYSRLGASARTALASGSRTSRFGCHRRQYTSYAWAGTRGAAFEGRAQGWRSSRLKSALPHAPRTRSAFPTAKGSRPVAPSCWPAMARLWPSYGRSGRAGLYRERLSPIRPAGLPVLMLANFALIWMPWVTRALTS